ncbi:hypothetical protein MTsPCn9_34130 [Croceitalea sp. MTPC9]|nr:hypothetical protein MTsPCn6_34820 [Croceitalea sp. MTPC6]GMN18473.1 hypothetical protein MTsPCn9_34130 [Croceitalea sp. MTPC9]
MSIPINIGLYATLTDCGQLNNINENLRIADNAEYICRLYLLAKYK